MDDGMKPFMEITRDRNPGYWVFTVLVLLIWTTSTVVSEKRVGIDGKREPCSNEGEIVSIDSIKNMNCFKCICKNGFVECPPEFQCPPVDNCYMRIEKPKNECCSKCKGCTYDGAQYPSDTTWRDKNDSCVSFSCEAGVVTSSKITCYTPCERPRPPAYGECCPTCDGCVINGQQVTEGRDVTTPEDPCLRCSCSKGRLTCSKRACPVLQCPITKQIKTPGECCPKCVPRDVFDKQDTSCIFGKDYHPNGATFNADPCSTCRCVNGTSICQRNTCPVLECRLETQLPIIFGDGPNSMCCPSCPPPEEIKRTCTFQGKMYKEGDSWKLDACKSCQCRSGGIRCAMERCPKHFMGASQHGTSTLQGSLIVPCPPGEKLVRRPGQCCPQCVENDGVCTVFGDPHYRTFDGAFFSHRGACKYLLAADCSNSSSGSSGAFSIRVTSGETRRFMWNVKRGRRGNNEKRDTVKVERSDRRIRHVMSSNPKKIISISNLKNLKEDGASDTNLDIISNTEKTIFDKSTKLSASNSENYFQKFNGNHKHSDELAISEYLKHEATGENQIRRYKREDNKKRKLIINSVNSGKIRENVATAKSGARSKSIHKVSRRDGILNEAFVTTASAWTRTVTLRIGDDLKVNLGRRQRVKVNGKRIELPFFMQDQLSIEKHEGNIKVDTNIGISLLWDGVSFLEVSASTKYKGKLCGLCGNFNSIGRDDIISRGESMESSSNQDSDIRKFAESWRVGGRKACIGIPQYFPSQKRGKQNHFDREKKNKQGKLKPKQPNILFNYLPLHEFKCNREMRSHAKNQCKRLRDSELFGGCDSRLNPENFIAACVQDVCECQARLDLHSIELSRVVRSQDESLTFEDGSSNGATDEKLKATENNASLIGKVENLTVSSKVNDNTEKGKSERNDSEIRIDRESTEFSEDRVRNIEKSKVFEDTNVIEKPNVLVNDGEAFRISKSIDNIYSNSNKTIVNGDILKNSFKLLNDDSGSTVKTVNRHFFTNEDSSVSLFANYKRVTSSNFGGFSGDNILRDYMHSHKRSGIERRPNGKGSSDATLVTVVGCHCAAFTAYARSCSRLGAAPSSAWKNITGCERRDGALIPHNIPLHEHQITESRWPKQRRRKPMPYATLVSSGDTKQDRRVQSTYEPPDVTLQQAYEQALRENISNEGSGKKRKSPPELY